MKWSSFAMTAALATVAVTTPVTLFAENAAPAEQAAKADTAEKKEAAPLTIAPSPEATALQEKWARFSKEHPMPRLFDAAQEFGVSEATLVAANCGGISTRLEPRWKDLLMELEKFGRVMALTRNPWAVIEKHGNYRPVRFDGDTGLVHEAGIDLRIFLEHWNTAYAVRKDNDRGLDYSVQFFDKNGNSVHKVFIKADHKEAFETFAKTFASKDQVLPSFPAATPYKDEVADDKIDVAGLQKEWDGLKDTHDFVTLLEKFKTGRLQALRLAGAPRAEKIDLAAYKKAIEGARDKEIPIMVFVGNEGCIEIHTGPVQKVAQMEGWFNILDSGFNLHLKEAGVDSVWRVRKPTSEGVVTSIELFDKEGKPIAWLFGKRKPGVPELETWRTLAESLPKA